MYKVDKDLLSIQEARIYLESAREAALEMKSFSQGQLDSIVEKMAQAVRPYTEELAKDAAAETDYGLWQHKALKNRFICEYLLKYLQEKTYVGVVAENQAEQLLEIGVPVGVIAALIPATNPVSTTIHNTLIAIKAGNPIILSPHPRARQTILKAARLMMAAAQEAGLPDGGLNVMQLVSPLGTQELLQHEATSLVLATGIPSLIPQLQQLPKPFIYGGSGNGPVFVERTCCVEQAVKQIIESRTFDNGIVSAAEQSVVLDGPIAETAITEFIKQGAYFMSADETQRLLAVLTRTTGGLNPEAVGQSAGALAAMAGLSVPAATTVLVYQQDYVAENNPFSQEFFSPVLALFIEPNWQQACEKCIELLMVSSKSHTLVVHSQDEQVIREFSLKKPVARVLVNTPSTLGGMGATTNLIPSMTLGSTSLGSVQASENISPKHLVHTRMVGYGVREITDCFEDETTSQEQLIESVIKKLLEKM